MTMKKKLTVTTMAASILFASLAGLPLSEKGLANKLGITAGVASASTPSFQDNLNALRTELARDTQGLADVVATKQLIDTENYFSESDMATILGPVWDKLSGAGVDVTPVFELFNSLDLFYNESGNNIDALLGSEEVRTALNTLFGAKGLPLIGEAGSLSKQSVIDFQQAALTALQAKQSDLLASVIVALSSSGSIQDVLDAVNTIVKTDLTNSDLFIINFFKAYHISLNDLDVVQSNLAQAAGERAQSARTALVSSGVRYLLKDDIKYAPLTLADTVITPGLTVFGSNLVNNYLTWSIQPGTDEHVKFESGKFQLVGANSGHGVLQARDSKYNLLLYISNPITLSVATSSSGGGGPVTDAASQASASLKNLENQLKDASEEKKAEIFKQAQEAVQNAIKELATLDLSKLVKVDGDTAKPTLDTTELANKMKDIAAKAKALNDQLKKLNPNAKEEKIHLNLDFGTISAKNTEIPLGKALLDAAIANGVETVAISINGLTLGVSPSEFGSDTTLKVSNQDTKVATSVTQLPVAAGVYEFEFTTGGSKISNFNTPVEVTIPVPNGSKYDTELLSLAKIVDGKLEFYGGSYEDGVLNAQRTGFSTYTVVENKVEFGDTASVKAWAGRQIQVAAAKGILEGRAEKAFDPNGLVTRAEFAKMIVKTFSLENASATESFTDVNDSDWYKVYVASAVKNGIVNGKEAGKFDPNGNITRAEMAVMSSRALAFKGIALSPAKVEEALKGFTDASTINASLKDGVALAASEGIVIGEEGNAFNPNANSTRAQAAVVIYRLLNK